MDLPTGRPGQAAALGLTLLAAAAILLGVVGPLADLHAGRAEDLARRAALAARMEALAATLPGLERDAARPAAGAPEAALLEGDSDATASALLQERLQAMLGEAGVRLGSAETLPGEDAAPYRRIRLRVTFNASWPGFIALLRALHTAAPALLVDDLQIQPALHRISTAPGMFDITCVIFAHRAAGKPAP